MILDEWNETREALFRKLCQWCGELPRRGDLNVEHLSRREYSTHTEVKVAYDGEPDERRRSLGADTTIWAMPFDDRIRAATIRGGGLMIYGKSLPYGLPYEDILRLIAPRPFFEVTGAWDDVNWKECEKPATTDQAFQKKRLALRKAREVYSLYGKEHCLQSHEFEGEHAFPKEGRDRAYTWLKKWVVEDDQ